MKTIMMDRETLLATWQNARWFAGAKMKWKKIGENLYRVRTNYELAE